MDSLSKLNQVAHILRRRLANTDTAAKKPEGRSATQQAPAQDLKQVVGQKIKQLKSSGAQERQLHRATIAAILQHQFGDDSLTLDPDYQHLIDLVCEAIESDPELLAAVGSIVDEA
ncbi:hypothetical protein N5K27_27170 [Pigmentiphaga sp. GD03639]|uniref:hypothetical protein n=1 Tax=Pigmentiphaga sp. GD03639 TaxID=2975354 RepID=UPI00244BBAA6|nr:hypothetical protein [Pigmentiphaga sp. GD03639]MDH2239983.1 hypothetical protein [Pigmentiphaga sp. GD03639]